MATLCCFVSAALTVLSVVPMVYTEECPPWFTQENSTSSNSPTCVCSTTQQYKINCNQVKQESSLTLGYCAFQDTATNGTVVAACPYVFPKHLIVNYHIPLPRRVSELNSFMCGNLNREIGTYLCGRCANGTGPAIYYFGSKCVPCSAVNILYYLLLQYLPNTIMFLAIIVFRINITAAPIVHYVLFCNAVVIYIKSFAGGYANFVNTITNGKLVFKVFSSLLLPINAVWSFDTFLFVSPPLCFSEHIQEIYIPYLNTLAALYPFILLLITYAAIQLHAHDYKLVVRLWKLFYRTYVRFRRAWDPKASMIQAFATLLFLSYTKFILLMYEPLLLSTVDNQKHQVVTRTTYIDPTIPIFNSKHLFLIALSVVIFIFIILLPILLLLIFPTRLFNKLSCRLNSRWVVSIQIFVDTIQGCYKDGTDGTRDYRVVSGCILAIWVLIPAVEMIAASFLNIFITAEAGVMFLTALTLLCAALRPYKHTMANISAVALLSLMALLGSSFIFVVSNTFFMAIMLIFLLSLPHCVFYGYIVCRLRKIAKQYCCQPSEDDEQRPLRTPNSRDYSEF